MAAHKTTGDKTIHADNAGKDDNSRRLFFVSALNMTWQLAVVVLLPIGGGFQLDKKFGTLPILTIIGFIVAITSMVIVVNRQLRAFGPPPKTPIEPKDKA